MNDTILDNYHRLVERVDHLCTSITGQLADRLRCSAGCSGCCKPITLFPVEAAALRAACALLPEGQQAAIREGLRGADDPERCPLLADDRCLLYAARPIICRTHGLPILLREEGGSRVDCCPLNLEGLDQLPGSAIIDLDRLNELQVAVNALYLKQCDPEGGLPERLTLAEALAGEKEGSP